MAKSLIADVARRTEPPRPLSILIAAIRASLPALRISFAILTIASISRKAVSPRAPRILNKNCDSLARSAGFSFSVAFPKSFKTSTMFRTAPVCLLIRSTLRVLANCFERATKFNNIVFNVVPALVPFKDRKPNWLINANDVGKSTLRSFSVPETSLIDSFKLLTSIVDRRAAATN